MFQLPLEKALDERGTYNRYIEAVKKATLVKKISATQEIWTMYYEFSAFGISPRVFTVLQVTHYDSSNTRTGCIHLSHITMFTKSLTHTPTEYSSPFL